MWRLNYSMRRPSDSPEVLSGIQEKVANQWRQSPSFTMQREVALGENIQKNKRQQRETAERSPGTTKPLALKLQEFFLFLFLVTINMNHILTERNIYNQTAHHVCARFDRLPKRCKPKRSTADKEYPRGLNLASPMKGVIFLGTIPTPGDLSTDDQLWPALCEPISY